MHEGRHLRWCISVAFALLILFVVCTGSSSSQREYLFTFETRFTVYLAPWHVDSADLNDDGFMDLVIANRNSGSVTVALNSGTGIFESPWTYGVGYSPWELDLADIDGDGDEDIAVTLTGVDVVGPPEDDYDFVAVLFNDGEGGYSGLKRYPVGNDPRTVFLADLGEDANGDVDIITANEQATSSLSVLYNDGYGNFSAAQNYSLGLEPRSLFVSDLNGDGYNDVVTANKHDNITIMFNNGTGGLSVVDETYVGWSPYDVYVEDVTGDSFKDIIVLEKTDGAVEIRKNDGTGNFTFHERYSIGNYPFEYLIVGDADLDGHKDILCSSMDEDRLSILYYNATTQLYDLYYITVMGGPRTLVLEDFNIGRPGMMNIVTTNANSNSVSILVSDAPPMLTIIEPDGFNDTVEFEFRIEWEDFDPDSNALIHLYYYLSGSPSDTTYLGDFYEDDPIDFLVLNVSSLEEGDYYVKMVILDDYTRKEVISEGPFTVDFPEPETAGSLDPSLVLVIVVAVVAAVMILLLYFTIRKKPEPVEEPPPEPQMQVPQSSDGFPGRP